jgi:hypothetical protein
MQILFLTESEQGRRLTNFIRERKRKNAQRFPLAAPKSFRGSSSVVGARLSPS